MFNKNKLYYILGSPALMIGVNKIIIYYILISHNNNNILMKTNRKIETKCKKCYYLEYSLIFPNTFNCFCSSNVIYVKNQIR